MAGRLSYTARLAHQRWAHHETPSAEQNLALDLSASIEMSL
jgi:hypothetical protein